ncbi:MAG: CHAT domain-containing protein, partial [Oscillatoriales cyanobacterium]
LQTAPTRAMALQQAQIAMLQGDVRIEGGTIVGLGEPLPLPENLVGLPDMEFSHPYYWSAFTMIGGPW